MSYIGGCYCGALRYEVDGDPIMKGQCHCRECQYISGGSVNVFMAMPKANFAYSRGEPAEFTRSDLETPVTRQFCATCGTHLVTLARGLADAVILKVGTLDDPSAFGGPQVAIFTCDQQSYQLVPDGVPTFERMPG